MHYSNPVNSTVKTMTTSQLQAKFDELVRLAQRLANLKQHHAATLMVQEALKVSAQRDAVRFAEQLYCSGPYG